MNKTRFISVLLLLAACDDTDERVGPSDWLGHDNHFWAFGTLDEEDLDIEMRGDAAGSDRVWCEREYVAPDDGHGMPDYERGHLDEFRIHGSTEVEGELRQFEIEFKRHDFQSDAPGTSYAIVPRAETMDPAMDEIWLEWEWKDAEDGDLFEEAAQEGSFMLEAFEGSVGADGLVIPTGEGKTGGFMTARWGTIEEVSLSFSVDCMVSDVVLEE
jgi:hypothetical protein